MRDPLTACHPTGEGLHFSASEAFSVRWFFCFFFSAWHENNHLLQQKGFSRRGGRDVFLWLCRIAVKPIIAPADGSPHYVNSVLPRLSSNLAWENVTGTAIFGVVCQSCHLCGSAPAHRVAFTCGSLLSPSRKFVLAARCGKHHRRQRWDSRGGERAFEFTSCHGNHLYPQNSLLPTFRNSGTAYSVNWQIWKHTKSNTHTHTWGCQLKRLSWSSICFYTQMLSRFLKSCPRDHLISQVEHLFSA